MQCMKVLNGTWRSLYTFSCCTVLAERGAWDCRRQGALGLGYSTKPVSFAVVGGPCALRTFVARQSALYIWNIVLRKLGLGRRGMHVRRCGLALAGIQVRLAPPCTAMRTGGGVRTRRGWGLQQCTCTHA